MQRTLAAAAAICVLAVFGTVPTTPSAPPGVKMTVVVHVHHQLKLPRAVTYAVAGDSVSAGYAGMLGWPAFVSGPVFESGSFQVGLRSDQIVDAALAHAPAADVLVIMGCTNDLIQGYDWHRCLDQWDRLADAVDMPIIVAAVAPSNGVPATTLAYNAALLDHAQDRGWLFVDPYTEIRNPDGTYLPGFQRDASVDPYHPSNDAQALAAARLGAAITALVHGAKLL